MELNYEKDNLERMPQEHYLELFAKADPEEIAQRCNIAYNPETREFRLHVMEKEYYISHPDFNVRKANEDDNSYHSMLEFYKTRVLVLRYMLEGKYQPAGEKYVTYRELPRSLRGGRLRSSWRYLDRELKSGDVIDNFNLDGFYLRYHL